MTDFHLSVLGSVGLTVQGQQQFPMRSARAQALLLYLAVCAGYEQRTPTRQELIDVLWLGLPLASARQNLRQTLYVLRKALSNLHDIRGAPIKLLVNNCVARACPAFTRRRRATAS